MVIISSVRNWLFQLGLHLRFKRHNRIGRGVRFSPDTAIGKNCRIGNGVVFGRQVKLGDNVSIGSGAWLERIEIDDNSVVEGQVIITGHGDGRIKIGRESFVAHHTVLDWSADITIGDYVHIGYSYFWTHSSARQALNRLPLNQKIDKYRLRAPITLEDCVYIGVHSTIYPGVTIGHHSLVAPNSVVSKDVPPYSMVGGVPAKFIKHTYDMIDGYSEEQNQAPGESEKN